MDIDTEALRAIRCIRVRIDPIPYRTHAGLKLFRPDEIPDSVIQNRLNRLESAPNDKPIQTALVDEVVQSLSQSSMQDARFVQSPELVATFMYAFEQYSDEHGIQIPAGNVTTDDLCGLDEDRMGQVFGSMPDTTDKLTTNDIETLFQDFRKAIVMQQHEVFLEAVYPKLPDELQTIPKVFWRQEIITAESEMNSSTSSSESQDNQLSVTDF